MVGADVVESFGCQSSHGHLLSFRPAQQRPTCRRPLSVLQWNQAKIKCDFFWTTFLLLPIGFGSLKHFWSKVQIVFYFLSETAWFGIFCGNGGRNCPSPIWGTFGGNGGPGKSFLWSLGFSTLARLASFYSITVPLVQFFRCSPCLPWQRWPICVRFPRISQVTSIKAVEHIFIAFRTFDFLDKHISVQRTLMINS